ncbi:MAG: hypothetical protein ACREKL_01445, partial [Chthoniobacterales bacterium]
ALAVKLARLTLLVFLKRKQRKPMENIQTIDQVKIGTNPLVTLLLFVTIISTVIFCGSYFSQQRSAARALADAEHGAGAGIAAIDR